MTSVQERREEAVETPRRARDPERRAAFTIVAVLVVALVAVFIAWLVVRDSGDDTETTVDPAAEVVDDAGVELVVEGDGEAAVETDVEFPFGWFENRDSGLGIMILNEDWTYTFNNRGFAFNGTYDVEGDVITVQNEDLESEPGTYRWTYEDGTMRFEVIEDPNSRRSVFLSRPFALTE